MALTNLLEQKRGLTGMRLEELAGVLGSRARALETVRWLYAQPGLPAALPASLPGVAPRAWSVLRTPRGGRAPGVERPPRGVRIA